MEHMPFASFDHTIPRLQLDSIRTGLAGAIACRCALSADSENRPSPSTPNPSQNSSAGFHFAHASRYHDHTVADVVSKCA